MAKRTQSTRPSTTRTAARATTKRPAADIGELPSGEQLSALQAPKLSLVVQVEPAPIFASTIATAVAEQSAASERKSLVKRVSREDIARQAFALYAQRGYVPGHHFEDWIAAEQALTGT